MGIWETATHLETLTLLDPSDPTAVDPAVFHTGKLGQFNGCATLVELQESLQVLEMTRTRLQIKPERGDYLFGNNFDLI